MAGPVLKTNRDFLIQVYSMLTTAVQGMEEHNKRLCALEDARQEELIWRNRLIGVGITISLLLPVATALAMRLFA